MLLDLGASSTAQLGNAIHDQLAFKETFIEARWKAFGGWNGFYSDILSRLTDLDLIVQVDDKWELGPAFRPNVRLEVMPKMGVKIRAQAERLERDAVARAQLRLRETLGQAEHAGILTEARQVLLEAAIKAFAWQDTPDPETYVFAPEGKPERRKYRKGTGRQQIPRGDGKYFALRYLYDHRDREVKVSEAYEAAREAGLDMASAGGVSQAYDAAWKAGFAAKHKLGPSHVRFQWSAGDKTDEEFAAIVQDEIKRT
jgi:hypothetical protein